MTDISRYIDAHLDETIAQLRDYVAMPSVAALSPEYGLRPLFMSLDGIPLAGVYATDAEFVDGTPNAELVARVESVAAAVMRLVQ
jgi:hypothetical protein